MDQVPPADVLHTLGDLHDRLVVDEEAAARVWQTFEQQLRNVACAKDALVGLANQDGHFRCDARVLSVTQRTLQAQLETLSGEMTNLHRSMQACLDQQKELRQNGMNVIAYAITAVLARRAPDEAGQEGVGFLAPPAIDLANPALGQAANNVSDDAPLNERIGTTFG